VVVTEAVFQPVEILGFKYPPYVNDDGTGMGEKIAMAAFQTQGYSVLFTFYPRNLVVMNFQNGQKHLLMGIRKDFTDHFLWLETSAASALT